MGNGLRLRVLEQPLGSVPPPHAGLLPPAHGGGLAGPRRRVAVIDIDRAGLKPLGHTPGMGARGGPYARVESVFCIVGALDGFVVVENPIHGDDGAERLLVRKHSVVRYVRKDGGLVE